MSQPEPEPQGAAITALTPSGEGEALRAGSQVEIEADSEDEVRGLRTLHKLCSNKFLDKLGPCHFCEVAGKFCAKGYSDFRELGRPILVAYTD